MAFSGFIGDAFTADRMANDHVEQKRTEMSAVGLVWVALIILTLDLFAYDRAARRALPLPG